MASDEHGNANFTFSVYFRPDEISPRLREVVAAGKIRRTALAEFFDVATSNEPVQQIVIDQRTQRFAMEITSMAIGFARIRNVRTTLRTEKLRHLPSISQ